MGKADVHARDLRGTDGAGTGYCKAGLADGRNCIELRREYGVVQQSKNIETNKSTKELLVASLGQGGALWPSACWLTK